jgi:Zn-dependent metalloprotease
MKSNRLFLTFLLLSFFVNAFGQDKSKQNLISKKSLYFKDDLVKIKTNSFQSLLSNINDKTNGSSAEKMAFNWISKNKEKLGVKSTNDLEKVHERKSISGFTLRFQQNYKNLPVFKSQITVHISPSNRVTYVDNLYDPSIENIDVTPKIEVKGANKIALKAISSEGQISLITNKLMIYNKEETTYLIYRVIINSDLPLGSWEVIINAKTGEVIQSQDISFYHNDWDNLKKSDKINGTGNVFLSDPLSEANVSYGGNYSDNGDETNPQLDAAMTSVTLLDIEESDGIYSLKGPYAEVIDIESPLNGLFSQSSSDFNFNRKDDAFEAVNAYYHIDKSIRYINETLEINVIPYQYSGGVKFDPHGLMGADNSYYSPASGSLVFGEGCVDDAEDADVILHELGHGIHDWLTGGSLSTVEGLSEGVADYWAQSYSRTLNEWEDTNQEYQWLFNWDGHNECWDGRSTDNSSKYPDDLIGNIYRDCQIFSSSLMRIFDQLGKIKTDIVFLEGLAMTNSSSNQRDAAIAIKQAAIDMNYSSDEIAIITNEFTETGFFSATNIVDLTAEETQNDKILIYPNPTKDIITIALEDNHNTSTILLLDNLGRTVYSELFDTSNKKVDITSLPKGIYTLLFLNGEDIYTKKIVKQ